MSSTIVCTNCGHRNDDGVTFCESCGNYLAWSGAPADAPEAADTAADTAADAAADAGAPGRAAGGAAPPPSPAPPAGAEAARAGTLPGETRQRVAPEAGAASPTPDARRAPAGPSGPAPPTPAGAAPGASAGAAPVASAGSGPAAAAGQAPPAARQPAEAQRRRPSPGPAAPEAPPVDEGPLRCWRCGTGNQATRRFCVRCGAQLDAVPAARVPWWRRLFRRRQVEPWAAGTRPRRARPVRRAVRVVALVLLLALAVGLAGPWRATVVRPVPAAVEAVRRLVLKPVPVSPVEFAASSSAERHGPELVGDGKSNTFWSEGADGTGAGQWVRLTFSEPVDLARVIVRPGAAGSAGQFKTQPRPRRLVLVAGRQRAAVELTDSADPQTFGLDLRRVRTLEVRIASVYRAPSGRSCSIAEIELWRFRT
jgi:hypothetical protein